MARGSTRSPGRLGPLSIDPLGRPSVPSESSPGQSARGVNQLSWATRGQFREPAVLTTSPRCLAIGCESSRCRPSLPGDSGPCPRSRRIDQVSRATRDQVPVPKLSTSCPGRLEPGSEGPWCRTVVPRDSRPVRGPARLTNTPGRLEIRCEELRGRTVLGNSGRARCPAGPTRDPGPPRPGFQCPRLRPPVPGDWGRGPRACGVDQLSWAS